MLTVFILSFAIAVGVSAFCSLMEASLYAVPVAYVNLLDKENKKSGAILKAFKADIGKPVAGILILNTIANTAGASICGYAASNVFGSEYLWVFSIIFTLIILYCSEIIPKLIGVMYCNQIAQLIAKPLYFLLKLLAPLVYLSEGVGRLIQGKANNQQVSSMEVISLSEMGEEEGSLDELEGAVIRNIITLNDLRVRDILTPRVVMFRLSEKTKIDDLAAEISDWDYSRIPLFSEENEDVITGYVTQRDIYRSLLENGRQNYLIDLKRSITTVPDLMQVDNLFIELNKNREHIAVVVDERGNLEGLVTLEDILEEIIGLEILDEYDRIKDLRKYALRKIKK